MLLLRSASSSTSNKNAINWSPTPSTVVLVSPSLCSVLFYRSLSEINSELLIAYKSSQLCSLGQAKLDVHRISKNIPYLLYQQPVVINIIQQDNSQPFSIQHSLLDLKYYRGRFSSFLLICR